MLQLKTYTIQELSTLWNIKKTQSVESKLGQFAEYEKTGRGKQAKYTITQKKNEFKEYCLELGFSPNTDFDKLALFTYFILNSEDFSWRSQEMMEEYLREFSDGPSRQTIGKYIHRLNDYNIIFEMGDPVYYKVYKDRGVQKHEIILEEDYKKAWSEYFILKDRYSSSAAMRIVRNRLGGVPRKHNKVIGSAFTAEQYDTLARLSAERVDEILFANDS